MATGRATRTGVGAGTAPGAAASGVSPVSSGASPAATDSLLPDPADVAGESPQDAGDADELLSQLAGEEIDRMLAEAQDTDAATGSESSRGRPKATPAPAPGTVVPSALRGVATKPPSQPPPAPAAATRDTDTTPKSDLADDLEREVIESVLREAGDAMTRETADALRGIGPPDPLAEDRSTKAPTTPASAKSPLTSASKSEVPPLDDALATELDALFAELSKPEPATEKLLERMAAETAPTKPAPATSDAAPKDEAETDEAEVDASAQDEVDQAEPDRGASDPGDVNLATDAGDDAVEAETQDLLDAVFDEATKADATTADTDADAVVDEAAEEEAALPPPATADTDAGLEGDLLKDVPSEPAPEETATDDTAPEEAEAETSAETSTEAAVEASAEASAEADVATTDVATAATAATEDLAAEVVTPADVGVAPVATEGSASAGGESAPGADASHAVAVGGYKPTTHRGPPFLVAPAEWRPDRDSEDNVLGRLAEVEHHRARWLLSILEWINRPFDFLTPEVRMLLGWAAIITLFNAIVVLVYVAFFKTT